MSHQPHRIPLAQQHPVLRRLGIYEHNSAWPHNITDIIARIAASKSMPASSKRQYTTQMNKVAECVAFSYSIPKQEALMLEFGAYMNYYDKLFNHELTEIKEYIGSFMTAAGQSASTVKAFLDAWIILGTLRNQLFRDWSNPGSSFSEDRHFPLEAMRMLFNVYDNSVQEKALTQVALLPTQEHIYHEIRNRYAVGSQERALLTMYTFVPLRDDLWDSTLIKKQGDGGRSEGNYFHYLTKDDIFFYNGASKTFGVTHEPVMLRMPPEVCAELVPYFEAINWGKYPFGRSYGSRDGGNSQKIIKLMSAMGIYLLLRNEDGTTETRGFGIDGFRRLLRTAAAKSGPSALAETTRQLGHSATTSLKYRGEFIAPPPLPETAVSEKASPVVISDPSS